MLPVKSNILEQGCITVSSDCVIWEGPNIQCINLCKGDNISDVIYKLAEKLCSIQLNYDLSDLDLTQLLTFCTSVGDAPTTKTIITVLDFIIDKIQCLSNQIGNTPVESYTEPVLNLPTCLQYTDPATGQLVTELIHNQYTLRIANQFCSLKATVDIHSSQINAINTTITNHEQRIISLENSGESTIVPRCVLPPTETAINVFLNALEAQHCQLRSEIGNSSQLTSAIAQQCSNLGSLPALSQPGTMNSLTGWNNSLTNLSQSFQNLWITVCDMRSAINDIKECCGSVDCSQFILDFNVSTNNTRTDVILFFSGKTVIPDGYSNCNALGSKVVIKDSAGAEYIGYVDLISAQTDVDGVLFSVSNLNPSLTYTITVDGCVTKSGKTCQKLVTKTSYAPCPNIIIQSATIV